MRARPHAVQTCMAICGAVIVAAAAVGVIGWSAAGRWLETAVGAGALAVGFAVIRAAR